MSMHTCITYGYGAKLTGKELSVSDEGLARLDALLDCAPMLKKQWDEYNRNIDNISADSIYRQPEEDREIEEIEEFFGNKTYCCCGVASLLSLVIQEAEDIELQCSTDDGANDYILFVPSYPWEMSYAPIKTLAITEEAIEGILEKYIKILSGKTTEELGVDIGYQECANCC